LNWFLFWLFLHILAAVLAFGPTFTFPIIGISTRRSPANAPFAFRVSERIERGLVIPIALTMLVSGTGLLISANIDLLKTPFLIVAIILYLVAVAIALGVLMPTGARLVHMTENLPAVLPPDVAAAGPPPEMAALIRRQQVFGALLQGFFLVNLFLMVFKPGGIHTGPLFG